MCFPSWEPKPLAHLKERERDIVADAQGPPRVLVLAFLLPLPLTFFCCVEIFLSGNGREGNED